MSKDGKPGFGRVLLAIAGAFVLIFAIAWLDGGKSSPSVSKPAETYRLVHTIGNSETINAKGISRPECEARKKELKAVAEALGAYNEKAGYGSITCLPESYFTN